MTVWVMEEMGCEWTIVAGVAESLDLALKHVHDLTDKHVSWEEPKKAFIGDAVILRGVFNEDAGMSSKYRFISYRFTPHEVKGCDAAVELPSTKE